MKQQGGGPVSLPRLPPSPSQSIPGHPAALTLSASQCRCRAAKSCRMGKTFSGKWPFFASSVKYGEYSSKLVRMLA